MTPGGPFRPAATPLRLPGARPEIPPKTRWRMQLACIVGRSGDDAGACGCGGLLVRRRTRREPKADLPRGPAGVSRGALRTSGLGERFRPRMRAFAGILSVVPTKDEPRVHSQRPASAASGKGGWRSRKIDATNKPRRRRARGAALPRRCARRQKKDARRRTPEDRRATGGHEATRPTRGTS